MNIVFTTNPITEGRPSVFLAGPTPRSEDVPSWRPEAISMLEKYLPEATVFVPEPDWSKGQTFSEVMTGGLVQIIEWEHEALNAADIILMWVPRDLNDMPAFTTNVEFGLYVKEYKLYYGRPDGSPKNDYLDYCYEKFTKNKPSATLEDLIKRIAKIIG